MSTPGSSRAVAYACLIAAMVIVGAGVPLAKVLVAVFPVFLLSFVRFVAAACVSVPLLLRTSSFSFRLDRRTWFIMMIQAVTGTFLFNVFMMYGVKYTDALSAGVILATIPAATAVTAAIVLRERISRNQLWGVVLAVLGLLLVNTTGAASEGSSLKGNLFVVAAVITEGAFLAASRFMAGRLAPQQQAVVLNFTGVLLFAPFAAYEAMSFDFSAPGAFDWGLAALHGIGTATIAVLLWYRALREIPAQSAAPFTGLMPVSAAAVAVLVLGESFTWPLALGMVLVLVALWLASRPAN